MSIWKRREVIDPPLATEVRVAGVPPMSELIIISGWEDYSVTEQDHRTGATIVKTTEYRLLCHRKHRARRFIQWGRGNPPQPLDIYSGEGDKVTRHSGGMTRNALPPWRTSAPDDRVLSLDEFSG